MRTDLHAHFVFMRILILRPHSSALKTQHYLATHGHEGVILPLLTIKSVKISPQQPAYQAIIITSAHALLALQPTTALKSTPLLTVGDASAHAARQAGFQRVISAQGDVNALFQRVCAHAQPSNGALLYVAGAHRAGALDKRLQAAGFCVELAIGYEAVAEDNHDPAILHQLHQNHIHAILLTSPRLVDLFIALTNRENLKYQMQNWLFLCLSPAIAAKIQAAGATQILTAPAQNIECLVDLLGTAYKA